MNIVKSGAYAHQVNTGKQYIEQELSTMTSFTMTFFTMTFFTMTFFTMTFFTMTFFTMTFLPSFLFASKLQVTDGDSPTLSLNVTKQNKKDSIEMVYTKTSNIINEELSMLMEGVDSFNHAYAGPQTGFALDGISVFVVSSRLKANDTIEFWSPERKGTDFVYYHLLDPAFTLMKKYMTSDAEMMYVEQLEQYFDYGVPIKKTDKNEFRIYGSLSYFDHVTKAINSLIDEIPSDEVIIIDMSNFEGMGTIYYPHFKKLQVKNNRIKWIVNNKAKRQLLEIGWTENNLEETTKKGFGELS